MPSSTCPHCSTVYNIKPEHIGKPIDCQKCNKRFILQEAPVQQSKAAEVLQQRQLQAEHDARFVRKLLIVGGAVVVVAILAVGIYFATRDTWERDNTGKLASLKSEAEAASIGGEPKTAFTKCSEALTIMGERILKDSNLIIIKKSLEKLKNESASKLAEIKAQDEKEKEEQKQKDAARLAEEKQKKEEAERVRQEENELIQKVTVVKTSVIEGLKLAKNTFNAFKRLEAQVSVGLVKDDYGKAYAATLGEVKVFTASTESKRLPRVTSLIEQVSECYGSAKSKWDELDNAVYIKEKDYNDHVKMFIDMGVGAGAASTYKQEVLKAKMQLLDGMTDIHKLCEKAVNIANQLQAEIMQDEQGVELKGMDLFRFINGLAENHSAKK